MMTDIGLEMMTGTDFGMIAQTTIDIDLEVMIDL